MKYKQSIIHEVPHTVYFFSGLKKWDSEEVIC